MKQEDFRIIRIDEEKQDYWFGVDGESRKELEKRCWEQGMRCVSAVVYSLGDGQWGIQREFMFNSDVITPREEDVREFLRKLAEEHRDRMHPQE